MKIFKCLLLLSVIAVGMTSCDKDEKNAAGTWEGAWGFDFDEPTNFEKWELKKNGDIVAYDDDGDVIGKGKWNVDGQEFEAEYKSEFSDSEYKFNGLYHEVAKEIIGTWGHSPSYANGGTFEMHKQ